MPSINTRRLGRPGRIGALHRVLGYMAGHDRVWIARREDIARHWMAVHSAEQSCRSDFVSGAPGPASNPM
ncbi:MAG: hypothetical protein ACTSVG_08465 [Alphaproteobacteria bacterium]